MARSDFAPRVRLAAGVLTAAVAIQLGAVQPAHADDDKAAAADGEALQEVTVTGSRITRRDYAASSPVVTVSAQALENQGGGTFGIKLQQLPQVTPGGNELSGSGQPTGRATIDLRGLGPNRTLVLADGRRLQPSTGQAVVDLNAIPSSLIDNVEIISGGASATYGSDAVAGVVNLKLKHHFQGLQLSGQYNITEIGDGREKVFDALMGTNFADGRGNIVVALDYLDRGAAYFRDRPFYRDAFPIGAAPWGSNLLPQGNFVPDPANLPSQAALNAVFGARGFAPGSVAPGAVLGFNPDGTVFGQAGAIGYTGPLNDSYVVSKTTGALAYNLGTLQLLTTPTTRYSAFSHGELEVADHVTFYEQAMFTRYNAITNYGAGLQTQGTTAVVPADNAFIPADLQAILASRPDPDAPFSMQKLWTQTGTSVTEYGNTVYQMTVGAKGLIGDSGWDWDVSASHGHTDITVTQDSGSASFSRIQSLLTSRSVVGPDGSLIHVPAFLTSSNGSNALIPNPAYATAINDGGRTQPGLNGAAPPCPDGLNLFSDAPLAPSCAAYLQIHPTSVTTLNQDVVEANLQGVAFRLPAGELKLAAGADYRSNSYASSPDPAASDLVGSFASLPVQGTTAVKEGYVEALIPVVRDLPLARSVDVGAGYRYSDYDLSGGVNTYKLDLDWKLFDTIGLRGGYQKAIRAPNVIELYNPALAAAALLGHEDPCNYNSAARNGPNAAQIRSLCIAQGVPAAIIDSYQTTFAGTQAIQQGNTQLSPETANTYTLGAVWRPTHSFTASLDYYNINLKNAISTLSADLVFARCFSADYNPGFSASNPYCQAILRNPGSGAPDQTATPYYNLGGLKTSGLDLELESGFGLGAVGLSDASGRITFSTVVTHLMSFEVQATQGAAWVEYAGTYGYNATGDNGAHPRWKANTTVQWSVNTVHVGMMWYHLGPMRDLTPGGNGLGNYERFDLFGGYQPTQWLELSVGINNLLNRQPLKTFGGLPGNTDSGSYDPLGRRYYVGFTAHL